MTDQGVRLEHALVYVRNLDEALAFYRRLFPEWTIRWEGSSSDGARWVHFGPPVDGQPGYLSLCERLGARRSVSRSDEVYIQHLGFAHPDVQRLEQRLASEGIKPNDRADDGKYRRLYFYDPDGHQLEFVQKLV